MSQTNSLAQVSRVDAIESRIDKSAASAIQTGFEVGGMRITSMGELMEVAKLMAVSDVAVPRHLRGSPGACLAVCIQAVEWKMSPWSVANKSYVVNDRIAYESQLIHAVVEQRAPLEGRLRCSYSGEGGQRRCKVWAKIKGESEPFEYTSAPFDAIQPKNSPLWKTKPDLQLFYNASRDWARMYFPDVILGVYADDEFEPERPKPEDAPVANAIKNLPRGTPPAVTAAVVPEPVKEPVSEAPRPAPSATGAGADAPPAPEPEHEKQPDPNVLPNPCSKEWICGWIVGTRPDGMDVAKATEAVEKYLRIGLPKPWERMSRKGQEEKFTAWLCEGFPWEQGG